MDPKLLLSIFSPEQCSEAKVPEEVLEVIYENESQLLGKENGQERCKNTTFPFARSPLKYAKIKKSKILLKSQLLAQEKEIREITLDFKEFGEFDWKPGDTIAVLPNNTNENVLELLHRLELENRADTMCTIVISKLCTNKKAKIPPYVPTRTTPREILRDCLNLKSVLKKTFLRSLAEYCTDMEEKIFLKCVSSKEGSLLYNDLFVKNGFSLIDILKLCSSCKPPFSLIVEHMSRLAPRPYSIASSPLKSKDEITFIFSKLNANPGITTKMMAEKSGDENSSILVYLREKNYFRYTDDNYQQNQILIAVGTGIAPFLGFLQHKQLMVKVNSVEPGCTWLFLGTTTEQSVINRDQIIKWHSTNVLNNYVESFSRTPTARFQYIQDALKSNAKQFVDLLMKTETCLYVCADGGQISKSIENCLEKILSDELAITEEDSRTLLKDFKTKRKFRQDIWL